MPTPNLDKEIYFAGDTITLTVRRTAGPEQINLSVTDRAGTSESVSATVVEPVTVVDTSLPSGRQWNLVSDDGTVATYTATA